MIKQGEFVLFSNGVISILEGYSNGIYTFIDNQGNKFDVEQFMLENMIINKACTKIIPAKA